MFNVEKSVSTIWLDARKKAYESEQQRGWVSEGETFEKYLDRKWKESPLEWGRMLN